MQGNSLVIVGVLLMAGCGSAIATHLGFNGLQSALIAGFALGIAILGQAPAIALRSRVAQLEDRLATLTNNAA
jgi:hypothetical protein